MVAYRRANDWLSRYRALAADTIEVVTRACRWATKVNLGTSIARKGQVVTQRKSICGEDEQPRSRMIEA